MPTISTTTLDVLEARLVTIIKAMIPRIQYQQDMRWKHYTKAQGTAARTRSFTILWVPGGPKPGGYFTDLDVETAATIVVRTDYAGEQPRMMSLVQDDGAQLRDRLNSLTADITSGVVTIEQTTVPASLAADTGQARERLSAASAANSHTFQIDLAFVLTYMQATAAA